MAKFSGKVGYVTQKDKGDGIWEPVKIEKQMRGDVLGLSNDTSAPDKVNQEIQLNKRISVVADPFAYENFAHIQYVVYMNAKWRVTNVDVQRPRLILTLGGVWNG